MLRKLVWVALAALAVFVPARAEAVVESPHILQGVVFCDSNGDGLSAGDPGIAGVDVLIEGPSGSVLVTTDANGAWSFETLSTGDFSISVPAGQGPLAGGSPTTPAALFLSLFGGGTTAGLDFGYAGICGEPEPFTTYTQGGWGAKPSGHNPAMLLSQNFSTVFPSGITVGGTYTMTFTCAKAVQNYLPAGGTPGSLTASSTDPKKSSAGVFGGQVLALKISVGMSGPVTPGGLGGAVLHDTGTSLDGQTVAQILAAAETVLGGGSPPAGFSVSDLNDLITNFNEAFDNGVPTAWAVAHL